MKTERHEGDEVGLRSLRRQSESPALYSASPHSLLQGPYVLPLKYY